MEWPIFKRVEVTGGAAPVELVDFRTLPLDPGDLHSPGVICQGRLLQAWIDRFGDPDEPVVDPEAILFCVEPAGAPDDVIGAGALYDVEIVDQAGADVTILCDVIVGSQVAGVVEAVEANVDGFVLQSEDPSTAVQNVTITTRG